MGVAVPDGDDFALITGNEMGILLMDFIARRKLERGESLDRSVAITTIVSSAMADEVAEAYGFELRRVLTGFKYIGEQIAMLEAAAKPTVSCSVSKRAMDTLRERMCAIRTPWWQAC
ncbi:MAG: hypothetical protein ACLTQI_02790 [Slackia sp.]